MPLPKPNAHSQETGSSNRVSPDLIRPKSLICHFSPCRFIAASDLPGATPRSGEIGSLAWVIGQDTLTLPLGAGNFSKGHFSGRMPRKMPHWNSPLPEEIGRGDGVNECVTRLKI